MSEHEEPQDCVRHVEYRNEWEEISWGAYRYGSCRVCGREFREYFSYVHTEAVSDLCEDGENVIVSKR